MSRNDVFAIAATESEHRERHTAVAAYVWGLGKNAYGIGRLVRAFNHRHPEASNAPPCN